MTPRGRRTVAYLVLVVFAGVGIFRVEQAVDDQARTTDELHRFVRAEAEQDKRADARACVTAWEVRDDIRASDVTHSFAAAEALIEVVQPDDPAIVDLYRAVLDQKLREASAEIGDPTCDLAYARSVLDNQE